MSDPLTLSFDLLFDEAIAAATCMLSAGTHISRAWVGDPIGWNAELGLYSTDVANITFDRWHITSLEL